MSVEFKDAVRRDVNLLILLAGGTGAGKTESAMRLATGLAGGQKFAVIDTERGRALHKADDYAFAHAELDEPFTPEAYAQAIRDADAAGFPVIVVDSGSQEWDGIGGVLDMQTAEFERMNRAEGARMASWIEPKRRHKSYVQAVTRTRAHVILCHRADDKIEIAKEGEKTVVRPKASMVGADGWIPICEKRLPFEATISLLLLQPRPGVPVPIKLEARHKPFVSLERPLDEDTGRLLAGWAAGGSAGEPGEPGGARSPNPDAAAGTPPVAASPAEYATDEERRSMTQLARDAGVSTERAREILREITGQAATAKVPRDKVAAVIEALAAEAKAGAAA